MNDHFELIRSYIKCNPNIRKKTIGLTCDNFLIHLENGVSIWLASSCDYLVINAGWLNLYEIQVPYDLSIINFPKHLPISLSNLVKVIADADVEDFRFEEVNAVLNSFLYRNSQDKENKEEALIIKTTYLSNSDT